MSFHTTISWSLVTSGIVTLLLVYLPYPSLYWGFGLLAAGVVLGVLRLLV